MQEAMNPLTEVAAVSVPLSSVSLSASVGFDVGAERIPIKEATRIEPSKGGLIRRTRKPCLR